MVTVNEYIQAQDPEQKKFLLKLRAMIASMAHTAIDAMGYGVPSYKLNGKPLVYYAAFTKHVGIYPASDEAIKAIPELNQYRGGKGTFKFPISEPIPYELIKQFVAFRIDSLS